MWPHLLHIQSTYTCSASAGVVLRGKLNLCQWQIHFSNSGLVMKNQEWGVHINNRHGRRWRSALTKSQVTFSTSTIDNKSHKVTHLNRECWVALVFMAVTSQLITEMFLHFPLTKYLLFLGGNDESFQRNGWKTLEKCSVTQYSYFSTPLSSIIVHKLLQLCLTHTVPFRLDFT